MSIDTTKMETMTTEEYLKRVDALRTRYEALESGEYTLDLEGDTINTRYGVIDYDMVYRYDCQTDDVSLEACYIKRGDTVMRVMALDEGAELFTGLRALRFNDTLIQNALPSLTPAQREFIMTGMITA